jgi:hypothetical protein
VWWFCFIAACWGVARAGDVRPCSGAGFWYPATKAELTQTVEQFLREKPDEAISGRPVGIIAPHAGYKFSGRACGAAFATLKGQSYKRVILLGFSHRRMVQGASILNADAYNTPLGDIPVDTEVTAKLLEGDLFKTQAAAHTNEHSLENELPFLQAALPQGWKLVPIFIGQTGEAGKGISAAAMKLYTKIADALRPFVDEQTLVVASSDWTHYGANYDYYPFGGKAFTPIDLKAKLKELDFGLLQPALKLDVDGFCEVCNAKDATVCGQRPICVLLKLMPAGAKGHVAKYYTSGELTGDWSSSVSYAAVVFTAAANGPKGAPGEAGPEKPEDKGISEAGQKKLLEIARKTLEAVLSGKSTPDWKVDAQELQGHQGAFVTLTKGGNLRGCIGCFTADKPVYRVVSEYAVISATQDHRFTPVKASELKGIKIEISVLSPMRRVKDPLKEVELGKHGIYIKRGMRSGTYLPQVATEHKMSLEEFLSSCCSSKAGLPADAWKDPGTEVYVYTAQVFHEE